MYQGSDPPVISQSPVPAAFIAGMTFHADLTISAVKSAKPIRMLYELSAHQVLKALGSLLGAMSPKRPLDAAIIVKKLSQNHMKNQLNDPMIPESEKMEGISLPISWSLPMVKMIQLTTITAPRTCHPSARQKACMNTTNEEKEAHTTPKCLESENCSRSDSWPIQISGIR